MSIVPYVARAGMQLATRYVPRMFASNYNPAYAAAMRNATALIPRAASSVTQVARRSALPLALAAGTTDLVRTMKNMKLGGNQKQVTQQQQQQQQQRQQQINASKVRKARYNTLGSLKGFSQAPKQIQNYNKLYNIRGSVMTTEHGGILSVPSTGCAYLAHSIAANECMQAVTRALTKEIMNQRRTEVLNWNELVPYVSSPFLIQLFYLNQPGQNGTAGQQLTSINYTQGSGTFSAFAENMLTQIRTLQGTGVNAKEFQKLIAYEANTTVPFATIHLKDVKLDFDIASTLTVQNRTLAENASSDNDRDEALDIENVPLVGKVYDRSDSWRNYLEFKGTASVSGTGVPAAKSLVADSDTGIIQLKSSDNYPLNLAKPAPGWVLGFKSEAKCSVNPGEVYANKNSFKAVVSFNTFWRIFQSIISTGLSSPPSSEPAQRIPFGFCSGFALEKALDTARSTGSDISIGYQIQQRYKCALVYKKKVASLPILKISTTPIQYATDKPQ